MFKDIKWIDLTHNIDSTIPTWSGSCGYNHKIVLDYSDGGVRVMKYSLHAGLGTHMDAPSHFVPGADNIGDIELSHCIAPLCIIDVKAKMDQDLMVSIEDLVDYEKVYGKISPGSVVVAKTGWERYWSDPTAYRNEDQKGNMHFPGFDEACAEWLLNREINGIGIDTLSPDGSNMEFPIHKAILGEGKYILENLANLDQMPLSGGYLFAVPMKVKEGSESMIRAFGALKL